MDKNRSKDFETTFEELSKSTKNIQEQLESVIREGSQVGEFDQVGDEDVDVENTIRELEGKSEAIQRLEVRNKWIFQ